MEPWLESFARANFRRSADTAHDLKTPLNVAVLNLELLRMRLRKLSGDDEKVAEYTRAIETELRRMGRIFDAFFLLSTPPRQDDHPAATDIAAICAEAALQNGVELDTGGPAILKAHDARIRQAFKLFFDGATKLLPAEGRRVSVERDDSCFGLTLSGRPASEDFEVTKIFKFYYTDPEGNPDLSLAVARLIAETYGGELNAADERDTVILRLSFPLGAQ